MTLLHVIKYPITAEFNVNDLERIPAPILIKWWENTPKLRSFRRDYVFISKNIMNPHITNSERARDINYLLHCSYIILHPSILKSLKKCIEEYDPTPHN